MVRRSSRDDDGDVLEDELEDDEELQDDGEEFEEVEVHADGGGLRLFLSGVILGVVLGAGTIFLTAPARGEVTRSRLKRRMRSAGDDARSQIGEWRDDAKRNLDRRRKRIRKRLRRRKG
jgi:hypothetical protein